MKKIFCHDLTQTTRRLQRLSISQEGYVFNTRLHPGMSNQGHDKDIQQDGKTVKLNWADDKNGALAIVEYLKTLQYICLVYENKRYLGCDVH